MTARVVSPPPACRLALAAIIVVLVLAASAHAQAWAQFGPFGAMRPPPTGGFVGWLLAKQAYFYRALAGLISAAKADNSAYWGLMSISFIYGVFHAAGPGHGKAVISSYLLANEETWRRGVVLSFASAVLQSLTAIAIVAVAAFVIGATAKMMGDAVRTIEIVSYVLIIVIGARLLWVKGRSFAASLHEVRARHHAEAPAAAGSVDHHDHPIGCACNVSAHAHREPAHAGHHHDKDVEEDVLPWGHAHGPEPQELAGPGGWRRGLSTIIAVGMRPCSGAIIVLVFALAQGLFLAGIASTFVMGLGTAITVTAIASVAVGAKNLAKHLAASRTGYGVVALRGIEVGAAFLVILFGLALLSGYMASERMGLF